MTDVNVGVSPEPWMNWVDWLDPTDGDPNRVAIKVRELHLGSGDVISPAASGVTVLVGANNAGKSTLLRQINAFLSGDVQALQVQVPQLVAHAEWIREMSEPDIVQWLAKHATFVAGQLPQYSHFMRKGNAINKDAINQLPYGGPTPLQWLYPQLVYFADARSRLGVGINTSSRGQVAEPPSHPLHRFQDDRSLFDRVSDLSRQVFGVSLLLDDFSGATINVRVGKVNLPIPARNEPLGAFGEAVARLPMLEEQGDGMVSFFGLVIPLIADHYSAVIVDEPEAFLHPPQARALGKAIATISRERDIQVILATHDKDLIAGLLTAGAPISVVRLVRTSDSTSAVQLSDDRLQEVWDDRTLRYSNVLDGLFAKIVVVAEADQDCRFYEAAFDSYAERHRDEGAVTTIPADDILFVPSGGKNGVLALHGVLRDLNVPTATILDIDALASEALLREIVNNAGGDWNEIERLRRVALSSVNERDWGQIKKTGERFFISDQRRALDSLVIELDRLGLFLVMVGELEGFAQSHPKNREWLPKALGEHAHESTEAENLVRRIMVFYSSP